MQTNSIILLVSPRVEHFEILRRAAADAGGGGRWEPRRADNVPVALARLAGGGVALVLLDASGATGPDTALRDARRLRQQAPAGTALDVRLWTGDPGELSGILAGLLLWKNGEPREEPGPVRHDGAVDGASTSQGAPSGPPEGATVIAFMGVKGGVGSTTAALNTATALASRGSVILAEIRPGFGSLYDYFYPGRMVRGLASRRVDEIVPAGTRLPASFLWPVPAVPGLRILFGPQAPEDCGDLPRGLPSVLLHKLAGEADFVVVDLPVSLSAMNREILGACHYLALVLLPVPVCVHLGKLTLEAIHGWDRRPASISTVVVKPSPEGSPLPLAEVEAGLQAPIIGVIPPAAQSCMQCERIRQPLVVADPESLAADSFLTLARGFPLRRAAGQQPAARVPSRDSRARERAAG